MNIQCIVLNCFGLFGPSSVQRTTLLHCTIIDTLNYVTGTGIRPRTDVTTFVSYSGFRTVLFPVCRSSLFRRRARVFGCIGLSIQIMVESHLSPLHTFVSDLRKLLTEEFAGVRLKKAFHRKETDVKTLLQAEKVLTSLSLSL